MSDDVPHPQSETPVIELDRCASTNTEAMEFGLKGEIGPLWVLTKRQTGGRGRAGRSWISQDGNLFASLMMRLHCSTQAAAQLSLVAGLAAGRAIKRSVSEGTVLPLWLKWPNDIMLGPSKVGGVLVETSTVPATSEIIAVVGFGVNVVSAPENLERPVAHLGVFGCQTAPRKLLDLLDTELASSLACWSEGSGFGKICEDWLRLTVAVGTPVSCTTAKGCVSGAFEGLDQDGYLLISDETGKTHCVTYGDVEILGGVCGAGEGSSTDNNNI